MPVVIPKIKKKNSLRIHTKENGVIEAIVADTIEIPNYQLLRADLELIERICCLIEDLIKDNSKNSPKLNKKEICIKILKLVFPNFTSEEVNICDKHNIEYLWNNNVIKSIPLINKLSKCLFSWVKKKVL